MPIEKVVKWTTFAQSDRDDREYWLCRTPAERTAALTAMVNSVLETMDEPASASDRPDHVD